MPQTDRWKQQLGLVWNVPQCVCWYLRVCVCACIWNGNAPWRLPAVSEGLLCQGGAPLTAVFMGRFLQESSQFRRQWFHMRLKRAFSQRPGFEYLFTTSTHTHTHTKGVADVHVCVCVCVCVCVPAQVSGCLLLSPHSRPAGGQAATQLSIHLLCRPVLQLLFLLLTPFPSTSLSSLSSSSPLISTAPLNTFFTCFAQADWNTARPFWDWNGNVKYSSQ